jgi:MinD-like ATPase involved in chromosome partitioning or flagellar assembly
MNLDDERGVSLRDLRSDPSTPRGRTSNPDGRDESSVGRARPAPREPSVPADIVARARMAMHQANHPETRDGRAYADTPVEPGPSADDEPADPQNPSPQIAGDSQISSDSGDAAISDPPIATPQKPQSPPWERPAQAADRVEESAINPEPPVRQWSGYNPDYVADRMVPMIHARATTGWRSWFGLPPSKSEQQHKELQAGMCINFGQPVKIVLANPRGYAGKTVVTIALAGALGRARGGRVCAFENHELRGVMALRTVANGTQRTTRDFINDLSQMTAEQVRHADLSRYVRHQLSGNFDAMVTARNYEKQLDGAEYRAASALLERFYEVIVIDTANNEAHDAFRAAIEDATVLVVPTKWRPTHITPATQMLNDMASLSPRHQLLVQNAVVVASNGANEVIPGAREMALPMFSSLAYRVLEIPPDPHIEADRPLVHDQLRPQTRTALDQLGGAVCEAALKNIDGMEKEL